DAPGGPSPGGRGGKKQNLPPPPPPLFSPRPPFSVPRPPPPPLYTPPSRRGQKREDDMDPRQARGTRSFVFFSSLLLLVFSPLAWAADQQGTPPAKHAAKPARTAASKPAKTEAAVPPLVDLTEEAVQTSFDAFTI